MLPVKTDGCIFHIRITPQLKNSGKSSIFFWTRLWNTLKMRGTKKGPWLTELYTVLKDSTCLEGSERPEASTHRWKPPFFFLSLQNKKHPLGSSVCLFFFPLRNLVICTVWKKYAKYSTTYPLINSLVEFIVRLRDCAMGANSTASTWFLNPHRTRWCSVCLQYLEKLKTDGHNKIREITCDSAYLKEDYLGKDKVDFLVLVKYSSTAFSILPVLGILSQSRNIMSGLHSILDSCYSWDSLLNRTHFRLLSSASQKENVFIQSNQSESVAIFLCQTTSFISHTSCSRQSPTHSVTQDTFSVLLADIPAILNTNRERSRQYLKSCKKLTFKG